MGLLHRLDQPHLGASMRTLGDRCQDTAGWRATKTKTTFFHVEPSSGGFGGHQWFFFRRLSMRCPFGRHSQGSSRTRLLPSRSLIFA